MLAALGGAVYEARSFAMHSWRFRVRSDNDIELAGDAPNSRAQVLEKMHEVIGRNVFQISLAERKQELEKIPWVEIGHGNSSLAESLSSDGEGAHPGGLYCAWRSH